MLNQTQVPFRYGMAYQYSQIQLLIHRIPIQVIHKLLTIIHPKIPDMVQTVIQIRINRNRNSRLHLVIRQHI